MIEKILYEELKPEEFLERINAFPVAFLPLGTLEWHGLHMPLGADGLQSKGVFEQIAHKVGGIVLPMLFLGPDSVVNKDGTDYYGMDHFSFEDEYPQQLEGSAYYIEEDKFKILLDTIISNLHRAGFKVVVAHGHGPSMECFAARKNIFQENFGMITYTLFELGYKDNDGIQTDHAAANETSLTMAIKPDLVEINKLSSDEIPIAVWGEDPRIAASETRGIEIIEKNVNLASERLKAIVSAIPKEKRMMDYHNVKSMLRS